MLKILKRFFGEKPVFYNSIENLPVFNWFKINETQDLSYLIINKEKARKFNNKETLNIWLKIYSEYLDNFGFNENFKKYLEF